MATGLEKEPRHTRKARLIKQSEMYRADLQSEAENLRDMAEWMETGYLLLNVVGGIQKMAPNSQSRGKKRNSFANILRGCAVGFRIWRNFNKV